MDRLEAMSLLIKVVESGSFSAAARRLGMPLTTISRKITDLENLLGATLLVRSTRKLTLTEAGAAYLEAARRIINEVDEAEREVAGEFKTPKGELVITAPVQFGQLHVLPIIADFLDLFPEINVRLLLIDRNVQMLEGHVDMAVRIGSLPDSTMMATAVGSMRTVVCASPTFLAAHGCLADRLLTLDVLQRLPLITFEGPAPVSEWRFVDPRTKATALFRPVPRLSVTTAEAAVRAALRHVGATRLLFYQAADAVAAGELQIILEDFEPEPVPVSLVHVARGQMPLKMRRFLDFAAPRLRNVLH
ncbi:LysR family transcriptional regulator [Rhizobium deserti]|uniref:HTH-type transcriptional regulator TtuA n=1 Tax=Rhizobium deserti TaxID=2547961 RepID=A0A4R5UKC5_9HYPH|nr:LysR substrate-binding domain-containing protein [Rhizobium deserti]TDK37330.1 LysR family transcriptional regulator [Rhizobium deserti]